MLAGQSQTGSGFPLPGPGEVDLPWFLVLPHTVSRVHTVVQYNFCIIILCVHVSPKMYMKAHNKHSNSMNGDS